MVNVIFYLLFVPIVKNSIIPKTFKSKEEQQGEQPQQVAEAELIREQGRRRKPSEDKDQQDKERRARA